MPREFHKQFAEMAIDALGGNTKVAELFGVDERLVSMWRLRTAAEYLRRVGAAVDRGWA